MRSPGASCFTNTSPKMQMEMRKIELELVEDATLMYHSHSGASFLLRAKHVQGVRPDGSTFKRTHKKWQKASFIHIIFKSREIKVSISILL